MSADTHCCRRRVSFATPDQLERLQVTRGYMKAQIQHSSGIQIDRNLRQNSFYKKNRLDDVDQTKHTC